MSAAGNVIRSVGQVTSPQPVVAAGVGQVNTQSLTTEYLKCLMPAWAGQPHDSAMPSPSGLALQRGMLKRYVKEQVLSVHSGRFRCIICKQTVPGD